MRTEQVCNLLWLDETAACNTRWTDITTARVYNCNEFTTPDDPSARREADVSESLPFKSVLTMNLQIGQDAS